MKHLILGLISLALLGFICAQAQQSTTTSAKTGGNNTTSSSSGSSNKNTTGTSSNNQSSSTTASPQPGPGGLPGGTGGLFYTSAMTTKNGQSPIFTSVNLLLGSFALQALWQ
ncbi:hypothetical protein Q5P01_018527 [Channa striata]|uniref:Uncharacterized protein n=1 Tax=Channa striata TaxID=64152 RepID=A0AA88M4U3_CHASR|nr:hypothetical protein Q5P01_018527 [Channa striata]